MQQFPLVIKHIDGRSNVFADWLLCLMPEEDPYNYDEKIMVPEFVATVEKVANSEESSKSETYIMSQNGLVPFF